MYKIHLLKLFFISIKKYCYLRAFFVDWVGEKLFNLNYESCFCCGNPAGIFFL